MHASLAITPEGLPLGLSSIRFWTRQVFKNTELMKRKIKPTRVPIEEKESIKWIENLRMSTDLSQKNPPKLVHVGDRESDIYEFFCECERLGSHFLIRSCVNRLANEATLAEEIAKQEESFNHSIRFVDRHGNEQVADLQVKVTPVELHPPIGKQAKYPESLKVTVVSAIEQEKPQGRERIRWTLVTNLPVKTEENALTVLDWYKQRWKIEMYFKVLKSGFKAEESRLRTADRLSRLTSISCILAWRIQWITMLNRESPQLPPEIAFDDIEIKLITRRSKSAATPSTLGECIVRLAKIGGYLARKYDPPPGNTVIWRGLNKLYELRMGYEIALDVGN